MIKNQKYLINIKDAYKKNTSLILNEGYEKELYFNVGTVYTTVDAFAERFADARSPIILFALVYYYSCIYSQ